MKLEKDTSISHYKILSRIGKGGMGEVYLARDTKLNRQVAIKFLNEEFSKDSEKLNRFTQEAQATSALNHPNILTVHGIDSFEDTHYIATEFIEGETLRETITKKDSIPVSQILKIGIQTAEALSAAHQAGIAHRDIKPENIMIRKDGYVKVLDFGLAKLTEKEETDEVSTEGETKALVKTNPGVVMGTASYMSPEQARGKETDEKTDIWSLGVVLYEMLAGKVPFEGETINHTIVAILEKEPKLLENIPNELQRIVRKTLSKEKEDRYQTARDVLTDLKTLRRELDLQGELERSVISNKTGENTDSTDEKETQVFAAKSVEETGAGRYGQDTQNTTGINSSSLEYAVSQAKGHKLGTAALMLVGVVVLTGFGYGLYRFFTGDSNVDDKLFATIETRRLTGDGKTLTAEISPDGKFLVFAKLEGEKESLWIKQIETNSSVQIVKAGLMDHFAGLTFSRNGNFVYFDGHENASEIPAIYRVPTLGGEPAKLLDNAHNLQFSPDEKRITFSRFHRKKAETMIMVANRDGSDERKIVSFTGEKFVSSKAVWSPDGKELALAYGDDAHLPNPDESIILVSAEDGKSRTLGDRKWAGVEDLEWHPSGDSLIIVAATNDFVPGQLWTISYSDAKARRLTNNLNGHFGVSITADGLSIVTMESFSRSALWVSPNLDPNDAKAIMPSTGDTWGFDWTPDNRLVYVSDQSGAAEVWIMNSNGSNAKQITRDGNFKHQPVVSPDGRYIAYTSGEAGSQLVRIDIDGSNRAVLGKNIMPDNPDFSPDGKWIIYSAWVDGKVRVFRMLTDGSKVEPLTDFAADEPRYSPDGKMFACFTLDEKGQSWNRIAIVPSEGGKPVTYIGVPAETSRFRGPVWTPDGKNIAVIVAPGEYQHLYLLPLDGSSAKKLTDFGANGVARREYSPDGKQIAIVRGEGFSNALMIKGFR
ncbi:MAG: protein kinase [Pyrinomonadaceae bacterium]|nr:protein kinase [Pyrinomonadaceae bacterium]